MLGLAEGFETFRSDMRNIFVQHCSSPQNSNPTYLRRQAIECRNKAKKEKLGDLAFILGALAFLVPNIGALLGIPYMGLIGILLSLIAALRAVVIELLAYGFPSSNLRPIDLHFIQGWNCGAVNSQNALFWIPLLAILMKFHSWGYDMGMGIVREYTKEQCG